jgi:hypothetical protein
MMSRVISLRVNASEHLAKPRRHAVLLKLVEQRPCVLEDWRVEALRESIVDRSAKAAGLQALALIEQEAAERRGGAVDGMVSGGSGPVSYAFYRVALPVAHG